MNNTDIESLEARIAWLESQPHIQTQQVRRNREQMLELMTRALLDAASPTVKQPKLLTGRKVSENAYLKDPNPNLFSSMPAFWIVGLNLACGVRMYYRSQMPDAVRENEFNDVESAFNRWKETLLRHFKSSIAYDEQVLNFKKNILKELEKIFEVGGECA